MGKTPVCAGRPPCSKKSTVASCKPLEARPVSDPENAKWSAAGLKATVGSCRMVNVAVGRTNDPASRLPSVTDGVRTLAPVLGPIIAGAILQCASWRWLFLVNLPLGAIALLLVVLFLPSDRHETTRRTLTGLVSRCSRRGW
jgi:hypothetical protein